VTGDEDVIRGFSDLVDWLRAARVAAGDEDGNLSFFDLVDQVRPARVEAGRVAGRSDDFGDNPVARVRKELMRRDRKTGRFLYPTTFLISTTAPKSSGKVMRSRCCWTWPAIRRLRS
jgi:hypothetical protein